MAKNPQDPGTSTATDAVDEAIKEGAPADADPLEVTVKDIGPARKCLTIEVPASRIAGKLSDSYAKLKGSADIPGFRRGRAPMRLIERRFNSAVRDDVRGQLISDTFTQAVEDEKLEIIGEPDVQDLESIELPDEGPLTFKVEVEVAPTFEMPSLESIEVRKSTAPVSEEDIRLELERLRERAGQLVSVEDAALAKGDFLIGEASILAGENAEDDAEQIDHQPQVQIRVPDGPDDAGGQVAGILVEDLAKHLTGAKTGEVIRISTVGPAGHENEKIRDQPITIVLSVKSIVRLEPAATEQLVEHFGMESEQRLKEYLQGSLEVRAERRRQDDLRGQISDYLLENTEMQLPEHMTDRQAERLVQRQRVESASWGVSQDKIEERLAQTRAGSRDEAQRHLKLFFILHQAAKELEVEVTEEQVNYHVATMAAEQGRRPEKLRQQLTRRGEMEHLSLLIRERTTLDKIVEKANVIEVDEPEADTAQTQGGAEKKGKKTTDQKTTESGPDASKDASA